MTVLLSILAALSTSTLVSAQCVPDLLIDNYIAANLTACVACGGDPLPLRYFNLLGGDYGIKDGNITYNNAAVGGFMELETDWGVADTSEDVTHPNAPISHNYWYAKLDPNACYDISKYTAFQFDLTAPTGTDFGITLTQKSANCSVRLIDSIYHNLTEYVTPNGSKVTVTLPLSDYATNLVGQPFDFQHLKDFTIINIVPNFQAIDISNFWLKGSCNSATTVTSTSPTSSASSSSATGGTSAPTTAVGSAPAASTSAKASSEWIASPTYGLLGLLAWFGL